MSRNTAGLNANGSYSGTVTVTLNANRAVQQTITVNLTVTGSSALSATPATLSFTGQSGASSGTPQGCLGAE